MRIAYVSVDPGIPVFGTKGASVHIQEVVRELIARGHDVTVYATRIGDDVPADLADLRVVPVKVAKGDPAARERAQQDASAEMVTRILADGADLVYERYSLFSTVLARVTAASDAVGVLEVNAPLIDEQKKHRDMVDENGAWAALRAQVHAAAATICVSDPVSAWVRRHTDGDRVHTVANGVSVTRILPQPEDDDVVVTFVGTLKPWHGTSVLIDAAGMAREPWTVRVVGDGPERAALEAQAARLGVDVDFRGAVAPEEMPAHLAGSAIGVAPYPASVEDGDQYFSPLKVYEYLAAGLPVVASSVGQLPGIITDEGVLVAPSDPAALARALDRLAADPESRRAMGAKARERAVSDHSWSGVVDSILGLALSEGDGGPSSPLAPSSPARLRDQHDG
ncbi:glycosyltransferase family 4 protein [Tessaracoccus flavus]|uniref:Glycosyl transferase family 1 n=1 Tax=Tessaracoccus flavus TaxID=1610493 RepID=A0A1Q2CD97_9ACTN|nr:glycosyltransferase family 4 protein [Tessaracoccus flavus]AQP44067.1 glycosyl transferase family 1 [Tessaracoccus flavus]SDY33744.1 Glycosyltransferase involved in cell wall bisynthesis [Tessaracoccus flavus]